MGWHNRAIAHGLGIATFVIKKLGEKVGINSYLYYVILKWEEVSMDLT